MNVFTPSVRPPSYALSLGNTPHRARKVSTAGNNVNSERVTSSVGNARQLTTISDYLNQYNYKQDCVRFQVLTAASMMFRAVFWVILSCKMIVDRRFRGAYCLHHEG
jgi:hypothetical protein